MRRHSANALSVECQASSVHAQCSPVCFYRTCRYLAGLGTEPGTDNVVPFANARLRSSYFWSQLTLVPGVRYYAAVKAVDLAGHTTVVSSDGVLVRGSTMRARACLVPARWRPGAGDLTRCCCCVRVDPGGHHRPSNVPSQAWTTRV